jgi:tetratricopeptide (TPR) repeat protein
MEMWIRALVASWAAGWMLGSAVEARGEPAQGGATARPSPAFEAAHARGAERMAGASQGGAARAMWALCAIARNDVAPLIAERGQPLHVLGGHRSELVLVWCTGGAPALAWFDGRGALVGAVGSAELESGALDPRRAPALRQGPVGTSVIVPIADGTRRIVDLATGAISAAEEGASERLRLAAEEHERQGDHAGAIQHLEGALAEDPTDPDAWRSLARALERQGEPTAARDVLVRGTEALHGGRLEPVSMEWRVVDPRARLAYDVVTRFERDGDMASALAALGDVERLYPCMEQATLHRASLVRASGGAEGANAADELLRATIERLECPRARAAAHLDAVTFHERSGDLELARTHLVDVLQLGEQREVVLRALARIDLARGEPALAEDALAQLRVRWSEDHASLTDDRRRAKSSERLARLDAELAEVRAAVRKQVELAAVDGRR